PSTPMSSIRGGSACIAAHLGSASILIFLRFLTSPFTLTWPELDAPLMGTKASTLGATVAAATAGVASVFTAASVAFTAGPEGLSSLHAMISEPTPGPIAAADIIAHVIL